MPSKRPKRRQKPSKHVTRLPSGKTIINIDYHIMRSDEEINAVLNKADELVEKGGRLAKLSRAQGVAFGMRWLFGDTDMSPMED